MLDGVNTVNYPSFCEQRGDVRAAQQGGRYGGTGQGLISRIAFRTL